MKRGWALLAVLTSLLLAGGPAGTAASAAPSLGDLALSHRTAGRLPAGCLTPRLTGAHGHRRQYAPGALTTRRLCPPATPGHASCDIAGLVQRSDGQLVRPRRATAASPARTRARGAPPPGIAARSPIRASRPRSPRPARPPTSSRPTTSPTSRRPGDGGHGGDRRPARRPDRRSRPGRLSLHLRAARLHDRERLFRQGQPARRIDSRPRRTSHPRRRSHLTSMPSRRSAQLSHHPGRGRQLEPRQPRRERRANVLGAIRSPTAGAPPPPGGQTYTFAGSVTIAASGDTGYVSGTTYPAALAGVVAAGGTNLTPAAGPRGFTETAWSGRDDRIGVRQHPVKALVPGRRRLHRAGL